MHYCVILQNLTHWQKGCVWGDSKAIQSVIIWKVGKNETAMIMRQKSNTGVCDRLHHLVFVVIMIGGREWDGSDNSFWMHEFSGLNLSLFVDMLVAVARNLSGNCIVPKNFLLVIGINNLMTRFMNMNLSTYSYRYISSIDAKMSNVKSLWKR